MEKERSLKEMIKTSILIIILTMVFVALVLKPTPWRLIGIITICFTVFVGIILFFTYKYRTNIQNLKSKYGNKKIFIGIGIIFIISSVLQIIGTGITILPILNILTGIGLILFGYFFKKAFKNSFLTTYLPIIVIIIIILFIRFNHDTTENIPSFNNEDKFVIYNESYISNSTIYNNQNCIKYKPIKKLNYIDSIDYINNLFLDVGLNQSNLFKIEKLEEGHGILFLTKIPEGYKFFYTCENISKNFPYNDSIDCRTPRSKDGSALLTTSFKVENNVLYARYMVECQ